MRENPSASARSLPEAPEFMASNYADGRSDEPLGVMWGKSGLEDSYVLKAYGFQE